MFILLIGGLFSCKPSQYKETEDLGFNGQILLITTKIFYNLKSIKNQWVTPAQPWATQTYFYDENGMLRSMTQTIAGFEKEVEESYQIEGGRRIKKTTNSGDQTFKYLYSDSSIKEITYDNKNKLIEDEETIIKNNLTCKKINRYFYDDSASVPNVTNFRILKRLNNYPTEYSVQYFKPSDSTIFYNNVILESDSKKNPIRVLNKENGRIKSLTTYHIVYK